jgi:hypothetical protein
MRTGEDNDHYEGNTCGQNQRNDVGEERNQYSH